MGGGIRRTGPSRLDVAHGHFISFREALRASAWDRFWKRGEFKNAIPLRLEFPFVTTWNLPRLRIGVRARPTVFVHVGPHKTATTSIQQALLDTRRGIRYPVPETMGPGHHQIAMSMTAAGSARGDHNPLLEIIRGRRWERSGTPIVFSSETFSAAQVLPRAAVRFAELADAMRTELIFTHRSIRSRLNSFLQERVKNGILDDFDGTEIRWSGILEEPAFEDAYFDTVIGVARWNRCHVVMVDRNDPGHVFAAFSSILGVPLARGMRSPEANASIPFPQMQILHRLHRDEPWADHDGLLARSAALFDSLRQADPAQAALPYPPIPPDVRERCDAMDARQMGRLHDLESAGRVVVHRPAREDTTG